MSILQYNTALFLSDFYFSFNDKSERSKVNIFSHIKYLSTFEHADDCVKNELKKLQEEL